MFGQTPIHTQAVGMIKGKFLLSNTAKIFFKYNKLTANTILKKKRKITTSRNRQCPCLQKYKFKIFCAFNSKDISTTPLNNLPLQTGF